MKSAARVLTRYTIPLRTPCPPRDIAVVSDLHDGAYDDILPMLAGADAVFVPGDLVNRYCGGFSRGLRFLRDAAAIAPTFYAMGNHEEDLFRRGLADARAFAEDVRDAGAVFLRNDFTLWNGIAVGGFRLPWEAEARLDAFCALPCCRLLMCHHPEHYDAYLRGRDIDLVIAGHAHGGQWRVFGRGVYSPGQGLFPKYTSGMPAPNFVISRGAGNPSGIPRFFNPCEVLRLRLVPPEAIS